MSAPDVLIQELRVVAGGRLILSVDALALAHGEALAVVGPNGAGKSTLLKTCVGLRSPASGRVVMQGQPVHELDHLALSRLRCRIGYIPQELAAHSQMPLTVREVVAIGRTGLAGLLRPLRRTDWQLIDDWVDRLGMTPLRDESYAHLSGGEQRKTLLARVMVQEPGVLLLDEPAAHLDVGWREQIVATLDQLYDQTRPTMIIVSHELEVLPACCRRLLLLDNGHVLDQGTPEAVLTPARVAALYGPGLRVLHEGNRHAVVPFQEFRA